jgi:mono/diheme cytochrome c family protein
VQKRGFGLRAAALACSAFGATCNNQAAFRQPDPDLNRMLEVPRYDAYEESGFFEDGMTMRQPPEGSLPFRAESTNPAYLRGQDAGRFTTSFPLPLDENLLAEGRAHFEQICSACHGRSGYGNDAVTRHMQRPAPSLHLERIRELPPGKVFSIISRGYGLMPDYAAQLAVRDRWAVVAYVKVLERSQYAPVSSLTHELREEASRRLQ